MGAGRGWAPRGRRIIPMAVLLEDRWMRSEGHTRPRQEVHAQPARFSSAGPRVGGGLWPALGRSPPPAPAGLPQPPDGDGAQGAERPQVPGGVLPREGDPALPLHVPDRPVLPRGRVGLHREDRGPLRGFGRRPPTLPLAPHGEHRSPSDPVVLWASLLPASACSPCPSQGVRGWQGPSLPCVPSWG